MSAISNFINTIRTAIYGEQVRGAIISALEQCYSDVNSPSLQTAAFTAALNAAYAGGILDIQTVTQISAMTNQQIIYRYNGTQAGYQKGLYYYSALSDSWVLIGSEIHAVSLVAQMTDTNSIYKYTGTQSGMVQNSLYCYNGTAWVPIGSGVLTASTVAGMTNTGAIYKYTGNESGYVTNALYYHNGTEWVQISEGITCDTTLTEEGVPADAKATGEAIGAINSLTTEIKNAILACFEHVAWANAQGNTYYQNLHDALFPTVAPFGTFEAGYAVIKDTNPRGCYKRAVAARACMSEPVENDNYIFTVTDSTKYQVAVLDITSLSYTVNATVGNVYPAGNKTTSWVSSDSVSTAYLWVMIKKIDGTEFTTEELRNGAAAVITVSQS